MAVREALLALLVDGPKHGYQLKGDFETATGSAWPLNVGQVYTTLQRLERDGMVEAVPGDDRPDGDDDRAPYRLTEVGRSELDRWFTTPSAAPLTNRDEATMRILLALDTGAAPIDDLLTSQRLAATETLQTLTTMRSEPDQPMAWRLQVDRMVFLIEAELRWLDRAEDRLANHEGTPTPAPSPTPSPTSTPSASPTHGSTT